MIASSSVAVSLTSVFDVLIVSDGASVLISLFVPLSPRTLIGTADEDDCIVILLSITLVGPEVDDDSVVSSSDETITTILSGS